MEEMMPLLEVIGQGHPDEFIQEMASDLSIAIATRGAVWPSLQNKRGGETKSMHGEGRVSILFFSFFMCQISVEFLSVLKKVSGTFCFVVSSFV